MNIKILKRETIAVLAVVFILGSAFISPALAKKTKNNFSDSKNVAERAIDPATEPASMASGEIVGVKQSVVATIGHHPQIKALQENRQAAVHDVSRARSGWLPRIDARGGIGYEQWSDDVTRDHLGSQGPNGYYLRREGSVILQQSLWDGLATWYRVDMGQATLDSVESRLLDNTEALSLDAIRAHVEIYRQRRIVALSERNVQNHRDILESQQQRQRLGASSLADVTQTESRLARAQSTLADSRSNLEVAMANYKHLTGQTPAELLAVLGPAGAYPSLDAAMASARNNNPKIKAAMADIRSVDAQKELGKANFHPQIYIDGGPIYRWHAESSESLSWGNAIMLRVSWNLFDGLYDWYNLKGNKARLRQSRQLLVDTYESLAEETESTWSQLISAHEQARFFANAVEYSGQTRDMYLEQFNLGQRSLLDVLDSENELFNSSMQLVTAEQNKITAQYRLLALGGELLKEFEIDRAEYVVNTDLRAQREGVDD